MAVVARGSRWAFDFRLHGRRYYAGKFRSEAEARDAETVTRARVLDMRLAREYGLQAPRGRIPTLRGFIENDYLPSIKGRLAKSTYHGTRRILQTLAHHLGMHIIADVTTAQLEAYRNERAKTCSANTLRGEFARIRQFFRAAIDAGHLHTSPARSVGLPRETRGPDRILTEEEQAQLLAAFRTSVMRDMTEFNLWVALRPGELCALRGRDVDLVGGHLTIPQPKTQTPKVIPLLPEASAILERQPKAGQDDPLFRGALEGKPVKLNVYRRAFQRAAEKANIPKIRPHDLRHTVAVRLIRAGADLATVGDLLGHKPPYRMTGRYLAHTNEDRKREVLSRLRSTQIHTAAKTTPPNPTTSKA